MRKVVVSLTLAVSVGMGCSKSFTGPDHLSSATRLSIVNLTMTGTYDGQFHYVPSVSVAATAAGDVQVLSVEFAAYDELFKNPAHASRFYDTPPRVAAGEVMSLSLGGLEVASPVELLTVNAIVEIGRASCRERV